jgi:hypothetical protein
MLLLHLFLVIDLEVSLISLASLRSNELKRFVKSFNSPGKGAYYNIRILYQKLTDIE